VYQRAVLEYLRRHKKKTDHKNFKDTTDLVEPRKLPPPPPSDWFTQNVKRVYRIRREVEHASYDKSIGNEHHLMHASKIANWVGILSRGLLLPSAFSALGIKRTDFGWLG
jgi:hypothetical protein